MKADQLKSLGFEANAFQATTTFVLESDNEIADVLLGLKPVQIENFQGYETRFGIKLPMPDASGSGVMHIKPNPADRCQVVVRGAGFAIPASVAAEVILSPIRLDKEKTKYLIRAALFDIEVMQRSVQLNTRPDNIHSVKLPLADWINFFRMMAILSAGTTTIDVVPERLARATITTKVEAFADDRQTPALLKAFEGVDSIFRLAGVESRPVLLSDVLPAASRYTAVAGLFSGSNEIQQLQFRSHWPGPSVPDEMDALYIDAVQVAGVKLAFSCIARMALGPSGPGEDGILQWTSSVVTAREITSIRDFSLDYENFAERNKSETGIDTVMMATYEEEGPKPG